MPPCINFLTKKAPYKGLGADSEEKHEPARDIDTAAVDSLKALDPNRPIREATEVHRSKMWLFDHVVSSRKQRWRNSQAERGQDREEE